MTQYINVGQTAVGVRQICSVAFAGLAPKATLPGPPPVIVDCDPVVFEQGLYTYAYPTDPTVTTLTAGGLFDLGTGFSYALKAVRGHCGAAQTMTLSVADRGGTNPTVILNAVDADDHQEVFDGNGLIVLPSQVVLVSTSAAGAIDLYVVKYIYP